MKIKRCNSGEPEKNSPVIAFASEWIGDCQESIWEIRSEMEGIGALLRCVGTADDVSPEELFGVGIWLKSLAGRLAKVESTLGDIIGVSPPRQELAFDMTSGTSRK